MKEKEKMETNGISSIIDSLMDVITQDRCALSHSK